MHINNGLISKLVSSTSKLQDKKLACIPIVLISGCIFIIISLSFPIFWIAKLFGAYMQVAQTLVLPKALSPTGGGAGSNMLNRVLAFGCRFLVCRSE